MDGAIGAQHDAVAVQREGCAVEPHRRDQTGTNSPLSYYIKGLLIAVHSPDSIYFIPPDLYCQRPRGSGKVLSSLSSFSWVDKSVA